MARIDLTDPEVRADAVARGFIWSAPQGAIEAACDDIIAGRIPMPSYVPPQWQAYMAERTGGTGLPAPTLRDGQGIG